MDLSILQIAVLVLGLILAFFGLPLYHSALKLFGFLVGGAYGVYLFTVFGNSFNWEPMFVLIGAVILVVLLGFIGSHIMQFANALMFFLAGGLVGVIIGKVVAGFNAPELVGSIDSTSLSLLAKFEPTDLIWFLGGGFIFIIGMDILIMFALAALGAGLVWFVGRDLDIMQPDWAIPAAVGVLGLIVQEGIRRRATGKVKRDIPQKMRKG